MSELKLAEARVNKFVNISEGTPLVDALNKIADRFELALHGLDLATDLLPTPEAHQDADWYLKQDKVFEIFKKLRDGDE